MFCLKTVLPHLCDAFRASPMSHTGSLRIRESPYLALRRRRHAAKPSIALATNARLAGSGTAVRLPLTKSVVHKQARFHRKIWLLSNQKVLVPAERARSPQRPKPATLTNQASGVRGQPAMRPNVIRSKANRTVSFRSSLGQKDSMLSDNGVKRRYRIIQSLTAIDPRTPDFGLLYQK